MCAHKSLPTLGSSSRKNDTPHLRPRLCTKLRTLISKRNSRKTSDMAEAAAAVELIKDLSDVIKAVIDAVKRYRGADKRMVRIQERFHVFKDSLHIACEDLHKVAPKLDREQHDFILGMGRNLHKEILATAALLEQRFGGSESTHPEVWDKIKFTLGHEKIEKSMHDLEEQLGAFKEEVGNLQRLHQPGAGGPVADLSEGGHL